MGAKMAYNGYSDIPNFYDRVRAMLKLDAATLPDANIDYAENAPLAEKKIKKRLPKWATFGEDKLADLETAVVIQTALNCYGAYTNGAVKVKQTPNIKIEYAQTNSSDEALYISLVERLNEIIIMLTDTEEELFFGFVVT
jgi:hypothetical protein